MKLLNSAHVRDKKVLLRLDLDVPLGKDGGVADTTRITAAKETVSYLINQGVSNLVLCGHIGRPKGADKSMSTRNLLKSLSEIFALQISYVDNFWVENFNEKVMLLENLRFDPGEEENDSDFAKKLAGGFDLFVNESFATAHRASASTVGVVQYLNSYAGFRFAKEVEQLEKVLKESQHPLVSIIGGAKIDTKVPVIIAVSKLSDDVLVGGLLPSEIREMKINFEKNVFVAELDETGMDVSVESLKVFTDKIATAKSIIWNGPIGNFENKLYSRGTKTLVESLMNSSAKIVIGGGDTISAFNCFGDISKVDWVCLGGGAMLNYIAGEKMPGIESLK